MDPSPIFPERRERSRVPPGNRSRLLKNYRTMLMLVSII